jgi:hypothetical protein
VPPLANLAAAEYPGVGGVSSHAGNTIPV